MCSIIIEDIFDEIKEENERLSEELAFIREKQKVFIQFKITFDLYSNKIRAKLESNEWQKFEILLEKLNDFNDIRKTPIINPSVALNTGLKQQNHSQKANEEVIQSAEESNEELTKTSLIKVSEVVRHVKGVKRVITRNKSDHKSDGKYKCSFDGCKNSYLNLSNLTKHKKSSHMKLKHLYCEYPECEYKTFNQILFDKHITKHSNYCELSSQTIVCHYEGCDQVFTDKKSWASHRNNCHKYKYKMPCTHPGCDYVTKSKWHLNHHMEKHSEEIFVCEVQGCAKSFKRESSLKNHLEVHQNKYLQCSFDGCDKRFETKVGLNMHMRSAHIRDTLYSCEWPGCEYKTYSKCNHRNHQNVHGQHKYVCDYPDCNAKYKDDHAFRNHRLKQHGIGNGIECSWPGCDYKSATKSKVKNHERIHMNDRKYACNWPGCQYRCVANGNIKKHMKVHLK